MWNLQHRVLYSLLLFTNCVLYILYIIKTYNKVVYVYMNTFSLESKLLNVCMAVSGSLFPSLKKLLSRTWESPLGQDPVWLESPKEDFQPEIPKRLVYR